MVRMARRPVWPPERAGNSGLNVHEVVCETEPTTGRQLDLKGNRLLRRAVGQDLLPS